MSGKVRLMKNPGNSLYILFIFIRRMKSTAKSEKKTYTNKYTKVAMKSSKVTVGLDKF